MYSVLVKYPILSTPQILNSNKCIEFMFVRQETSRIYYIYDMAI